MYARITPLFSLLFLAPPAADGWLGVYLEQDRNEAVIAEVIPGSPAAKAGLQVGDVMLAVGDQATANSAEFVAAIRKAAPGDRVSLKVQRKGKESIMIVKLGDRPEVVASNTAPQAAPAPAEGGAAGVKKDRKHEPAGPAAESRPAVESRAVETRTAAEPAAPDSSGRGFLGVSVLETDGGVRIERVLADSPARKAGLAEGDVLVSIGAQQIRSLDDLDRWITSVKPGAKVAVGLRSEAGVRSVLVEIGWLPGPGKDRGAPVAVARPVAPEPAVRAESVRPPVVARPVPAPAPSSRAKASEASAPAPVELERELEALRAELRLLRKQIEELRKNAGRE